MVHELHAMIERHKGSRRRVRIDDALILLVNLIISACRSDRCTKEISDR